MLFVPHVRKCSKSAFCGAERRQGGNTAAAGGISAVRSRACFGGVVLLTAIVAMGQRHPSVYKSGIINAFNPPAFAAAACALFTGMKLCRSCEQHEAVNNKEKTAAEDAGN